MAGVKQAIRAWDGAGKFKDVVRPFAPGYLELYRGGARALDQGFGAWFDSLERRGLFERGYLVFTSDHGEAFFEHGDREHGGRLHDEKVRVPLFLFGAGLAPRDVPFGAHHIDLAPTIAALAGLPPAPGWIGSSLLELDRERVLFCYNENEKGAYLAAVEGQQKLLETADAGTRPTGAFDEVYRLDTDPGELENLLEADPDWFEELGGRSVALLDEFFLRVHEPAAVELPETLRRELEALGYAEY
jgi:arylsulfatase A-like enzyme